MGKLFERFLAYMKGPFKAAPDTDIQLVPEGSELAEMAAVCDELLHHVVEKQRIHKASKAAFKSIYLREKDWPAEYAVCKEHNIRSMNGVKLIWGVEPVEPDEQ